MKTRNLLFVLFLLFAVIPLIIITLISTGTVVRLNNEKLDNSYKYSLTQTGTIFSLKLDILHTNLSAMLENIELENMFADGKISDFDKLDSAIKKHFENNSNLRSIIFFPKNDDYYIWGEKINTISDPIDFMLNIGKVNQVNDDIEWFGFNNELIPDKHCFVAGAKITDTTNSNRDSQVSLGTCYVIVDKNYFDIPDSDIITTYIYDNHLKKMYGSNNQFEVFYDFPSDVRQNFLNNRPGAATTKIDNEKFVFVYMQDHATNCYFIQMIPYKYYTNEIPIVTKIIIVSCILLLFVAIVFSALLSQSIISPVVTLLKGMKANTLENPVVLQPPNACTFEIEELYRTFSNMTVQLKILNLKSVEQEMKKNETDLKWLQYQINPHFIHNTLNAISIRLLADGNTEISESVKILARLLKNAITYSSAEIAVITEIESLRDFMSILLLRYKNKFNVTYDISDSVKQYKMNGMLLQPIAENAVYHGLAEKMSCGKSDAEIKISAYENQDFLVLEVYDNGSGFPKEYARLPVQNPHSSSHIGLSNINERIKLLYGDNYGIEIESEYGVYSIVRVKLPIIN